MAQPAANRRDSAIPTTFSASQVYWASRCEPSSWSKRTDVLRVSYSSCTSRPLSCWRLWAVETPRRGANCRCLFRTQRHSTAPTTSQHFWCDPKQHLSVSVLLYKVLKTFLLLCQLKNVYVKGQEGRQPLQESVIHISITWVANLIGWYIFPNWYSWKLKAMAVGITAPSLCNLSFFSRKTVVWFKLSLYYVLSFFMASIFFPEAVCFLINI